MYVSVYENVWMPREAGRGSDPIELGSQTDVSCWTWVMGTKVLWKSSGHS